MFLLVQVASCSRPSVSINHLLDDEAGDTESDYAEDAADSVHASDDEFIDNSDIINDNTQPQIDAREREDERDIFIYENSSALLIFFFLVSNVIKIKTHFDQYSQNTVK